MDKKYLKYKSKYLELKKKLKGINQYGGRIIKIDVDGIIKEEIIKKYPNLTSLFINKILSVNLDTDIEQYSIIKQIIADSPDSWKISERGGSLLDKKNIDWNRIGHLKIRHEEYVPDMARGFEYVENTPSVMKMGQVGKPAPVPKFSSVKPKSKLQGQSIDVTTLKFRQQGFIVVENIDMTVPRVPVKYEIDTHFTVVKCGDRLIDCIFDTGNDRYTCVHPNLVRDLGLQSIPIKATKETIIGFNEIIDMILDELESKETSSESIESKIKFQSYKIKETSCGGSSTVLPLVPLDPSQLKSSSQPLSSVFGQLFSPSSEGSSPRSTRVATLQTIARRSIQKKLDCEYLSTDLRLIYERLGSNIEELLTYNCIRSMLANLDSQCESIPGETTIHKLCKLCSIMIPVGIGIGQIVLDEVYVPIEIPIENPESTEEPSIKILFKANISEMPCELLVSKFDMRKLRRVHGIALEDSDEIDSKVLQLEKVKEDLQNLICKYIMLNTIKTTSGAETSECESQIQDIKAQINLKQAEKEYLKKRNKQAKRV